MVMSGSLNTSNSSPSLPAFNHVTLLPFTLTYPFCCTSHSWLLVCHVYILVIFYPRLYLLTAPEVGFIWTTLLFCLLIPHQIRVKVCSCCTNLMLEVYLYGESRLLYWCYVGCYWIVSDDMYRFSWSILLLFCSSVLYEFCCIVWWFSYCDFCAFQNSGIM